MSITAKDVNELRKKTGAGMMDCKKALTESNGNMEEAIDYLSVILNEYWSLKKQMAAGSEPRHIRELFAYMSPFCSGWSLSGNDR